MSQHPPPKATQQSIVNLPVKKCPDCGCKLQEVLSAISNKANRRRINSLKYTYLRVVERYNKQ